jgi:hypothetical protein
LALRTIFLLLLSHGQVSYLSHNNYEQLIHECKLFYITFISIDELVKSKYPDPEGQVLG